MAARTAVTASTATASTRERGAFVAGSVLLCAWCAQYGRPHGAARDRASGVWHAISHERARALDQASATSHGICPWCRPQFAAEWDLPAVLAPLAVVPALAAAG